MNGWKMFGETKIKMEVWNMLLVYINAHMVNVDWGSEKYLKGEKKEIKMRKDKIDNQFDDWLLP